MVFGTPLLGLTDTRDPYTTFAEFQSEGDSFPNDQFYSKQKEKGNCDLLIVANTETLYKRMQNLH